MPGGERKVNPILQHLHKKMPAIEIAGLCLPLKPQKERGLYWFINTKIR
jgi:hypothetical protein